MKKLLLILVLAVMFGCVPSEDDMDDLVGAESASISPEDILNKFPLCGIRSSLGNKCRGFTDEEAIKFVPLGISSQAKVVVEGDTLEISTGDWGYYFRLENKSNGEVILHFTDDASEGNGTYYTHSRFNLQWNQKQKNWFIISEVVVSIRGSEEDKKIEGKLHLFPEPIPFYLENLGV